jgi:hypothetical protein
VYNQQVNQPLWIGYLINWPLCITNDYYPNLFNNLPCTHFFDIDIDNLWETKNLLKGKNLPGGYLRKPITGQHWLGLRTKVSNRTMGTVVGLLMGWAALEIWGTIYIFKMGVFFWKIKNMCTP